MEAFWGFFFVCLFFLFIYLHFEGSSGGLVRDLSDFVEKWKQRFSGRFHFRLTDTIGRLIRWHRSVHCKCRQRAFETPGPGERLWDGRSWRYVCERPVILGTSDADPPEAFDCVPHWTRWHQLGGPVIKRGFFIDWAEMMEIQVAVSEEWINFFFYGLLVSFDETRIGFYRVRC